MEDALTGAMVREPFLQAAPFTRSLSGSHNANSRLIEISVFQACGPIFHLFTSEACKRGTSGVDCRDIRYLLGKVGVGIGKV